MQTKPTHNYLAVETIIHSDINRIKGCHSRESGNPEKHWIPPYQVRGRLGQARNDKLHKTYVVMYSHLSFVIFSLFELVNSQSLAYLTKT